jgi:hypothetical protein
MITEAGWIVHGWELDQLPSHAARGAARLSAGTGPEPSERDNIDLKHLPRLDWDAIRGVVTAVIASVLHQLHVVDEGVLLSVTLVILTLVLIRDLRRKDATSRRRRYWGGRKLRSSAPLAATNPPDAILIGPPRLREESQRFGQRAQGETSWFNVCLLMFVPQSLFDAPLRPAIENPNVTSIQFILDHRERQRWDPAVLPRVAECAGIARSGSRTGPSCTRTPRSSFRRPDRAASRDIPRYIFQVQSQSEWIGRLAGMSRQYRVSEESEQETIPTE